MSDYLSREILPYADLYMGRRYYFNINKGTYRFNWQHSIPMEGSQFIVKYLIDEKKTAEPVTITNDIEQIANESLHQAPNLTDDKEKVLVQTYVNPRSDGFRLAVRSLYRDSCAVCGSRRYSPGGMPEVESAHIYPKMHNGSDDFRNGIALCRFHHWAFDQGWFSIADDLTILLRGDLPEEIYYNSIRDFGGKSVAIPVNPDLKPHPLYLYAHRKLHGFEQ